MQRLPSLLRATSRLARVQPSRHGSDFKSLKELDEIYKATMDHLPKPSGSWQEGFNAKNRIGNIAFGANLALFVATLLWMENDGQFDLLFNPAYWSDKQVARQAAYYAKGDKWRKQPEADDEE